MCAKAWRDSWLDWGHPSPPDHAHEKYVSSQKLCKGLFQKDIIHTCTSRHNFNHLLASLWSMHAACWILTFCPLDFNLKPLGWHGGANNYYITWKRLWLQNAPRNLSCWTSQALYQKIRTDLNAFHSMPWSTHDLDDLAGWAPYGQFDLLDFGSYAEPNRGSP